MYIKKGFKPKLNPKYVQLDCCMGGIALEYQLFQFLEALLYGTVCTCGILKSHSQAKHHVIGFAN